MRFVFLCVIALSELFSGTIEINKNKEFEVSIKPDMYKSTFSLNIRDNEQSNIEDKFAEAIDIVSKNEICKGGKYNIYPHHKKDQYNGYINFKCQFEDKTIYEELLSKIKNIDNIKLSQGQIDQINAKDQIELTNEKLEAKALVFPSTYEKFLEDNMLGFKCKTKRISFGGSNHMEPMPMYMESARVANTKVTLPVQNNVTYKKRVAYTFLCSKE